MIGKHGQPQSRRTFFFGSELPEPQGNIFSRAVFIAEKMYITLQSQLMQCLEFAIAQIHPTATMAAN